MLSTVAWSDHKPFLLAGVRKLFETGYMSDLTIKCHDRTYHVHKLILGLFTDYFNEYDGLWMRISVNVDHLENALKFMYHGQVAVGYEQMEGFLGTCKLLRLNLFKPNELNAEGMNEEQSREFFHQERYELNDFQLLCRACYKCFPTEKALKKHTWGCLRPRNFKCRFCEKTYRHKREYEEHEQLHQNPELYKCPFENCEKTCRYKTQLNHHIKVYHEKRTYKCKECPKEYTTSGGLKLHMASDHGHATPYVCSICDKKFVYQSHLTFHIKTRHKEKSKREEYSIGGRMPRERRETTFADYVPNWDGSVPIPCPIKGCDTTWPSKGGFLRHVRVVHEKERYQCTICREKSYTSSSMLKWHMAQEHGLEKKFSCDECGEKFALRSRLNTHVKKKHTEEGIRESREKYRQQYLKKKERGDYGHPKKKRVQNIKVKPEDTETKEEQVMN